MSHGHSTEAPASPLVVQVGFAGSRRLLDRAACPGFDEASLHKQIEDHFVATLERLPETLGLTAHHFLCGVSQIAIGGDTLFSRACARLGIAQRVFLPQHRDGYLTASGENEEPDFTPAQATVARELLAGDHIIESRVVSDSMEREAQFEDVNLEIVRVSDIVIALRREDAGGKPGGTGHLIERALVRKKVVLEIIVSVREGRVHFRNDWHPVHPHTEPGGRPPFEAPGVPPVISRFEHSGEMAYAAKLRQFTGAVAKKKRAYFRFAALAIIGTHVLATICAAAITIFHDDLHDVLARLLGIELLLLGSGLFVHWNLHHSAAAERWATARLISEITRSVMALSGVRGYLGHLFQPHLPESLRHVLRTLNVFHLKATRSLPAESWAERRASYVVSRLDDPQNGQIPYYTRRQRSAHFWLLMSRVGFYLGSGLTILGTVAKLLLGFHIHILAFLHLEDTALEHGLGFFGIVLPVLAVAALSLAASFDIEAREHTYTEMREALERQREFLLAAISQREFEVLAMQTETRLVGENARWFARRFFTGVS